MNGMNARQNKFVASLVSGRSVTGAAEEAGVTASTAYRWLAQEPVRAELQAQSGAVMTAAQARLGALLDLALDAIADGLAGQKLGLSRRWAADTILRHAVRLLELLRLEERIAALEERMTAAGRQ
jgi:transposase-like protein